LEPPTFNILTYKPENHTNSKPIVLVVENNLKKYYDLPRVQGIVDYMYKEDWTNKLDSFYTYTDELDKSRNQNLYEIVPELKR